MPKSQIAEPFYRSLGRNLRIARVVAGKTQGEAAEQLDITIAQFQKYELGENRIPIDRLVRLAGFFEVPLASLIDPSKADEAFASLAQKFSSVEFNNLMQAWGSIRDTKVRSALIQLVQAMAAVKR